MIKGEPLHVKRNVSAPDRQFKKIRNGASTST